MAFALVAPQFAAPVARPAGHPWCSLTWNFNLSILTQPVLSVYVYTLWIYTLPYVNKCTLYVRNFRMTKGLFGPKSHVSSKHHNSVRSEIPMVYASTHFLRGVRDLFALLIIFNTSWDISFSPVNRLWANLFLPLKYNQRDVTFSRSIYFYKLLYMFPAVPPPIIRSTKLYIQRQVLSNQYCCLLLS
jgi:hypothetical protein